MYLITISLFVRICVYCIFTHNMCTIACILFSAHLQYSVCVYIYILHRIYLYDMYIYCIIISTGIMCKNDPITLFSWGRHECSLPGQDPSSTTSKVLPPGVLCKVHHANICLHPASMLPRTHTVIEWQYLSIYCIWNGMEIIGHNLHIPWTAVGERKHVRHQHQHLPRQLANQLDGHAAAPVASSETVWLQPTRVAGHLMSFGQSVCFGAPSNSLPLLDAN